MEISNFVKSIIARLKGDDAEVAALKIQKQATARLKQHLASMEGDRLSLEENIETAKENIGLAIINHGNTISDTHEGNTYVRNIVASNQRLQDANDALEAHDKTVVILKEALDTVSK